MRWLVDLAYLAFAVLTAPVWLVRMVRTGKIRTDWAGRLGAGPPLPRAPGRRVLVHAVSVGEVNAIRRFVRELAGGPDAVDVVIATTTDTGFARASSLFGGTHAVVRYPFDFSFAVARFLRRIGPDAVVLVELEVWPVFTRACVDGGIPVGVINGRLSARSARRYRRVAALVRPSFRRLAFAAVQSEDYAERFRAFGVTPDRVRVTGTMKWDSVEIPDERGSEIDDAATLAAALGIDRDAPLVVAGSTAPEEHALLRDSVGEGVQLLCAPRKPEWFDDAATTLGGCVRRTAGVPGPGPRFLLDTIGELRQAYALADVVVIGRSFGERHGSDMIESVALGKATVVGPRVDDFEAIARTLLAGDGLVQTDAGGLADVIAALLDDPERRVALASNGRKVIRREQGATARHVELVRETLTAGSGLSHPG